MPTRFITDSLLNICNAAKEETWAISHAWKKEKGVNSCYRNEDPDSITQHGNKEIPLLKWPLKLESSWVTTPLSTDNSVSRLQWYFTSSLNAAWESIYPTPPPRWKRPRILAAAFQARTGINADGWEAGGCRHTSTAAMSPATALPGQTLQAPAQRRAAEADAVQSQTKRNDTGEHF